MTDEKLRTFAATDGLAKHGLCSYIQKGVGEGVRERPDLIKSRGRRRGRPCAARGFLRCPSGTRSSD